MSVLQVLSHHLDLSKVFLSERKRASKGKALGIFHGRWTVAFYKNLWNVNQ